MTLWARELGHPNRYVHDEVYQAFTAHRYAIGDPHAWNPRATREQAAAVRARDMTRWTAYEWVHPPTAKLIMAASIRTFGFHAWSARLGSLLFGVLTLVAAWRLATRMRGPWFGVLVLALLATDGMLAVFSRVAMNDIYVTGATTTALLCVYAWWTSPRSSRWLFGAGALLGFAASCKWSAVPLLVAVVCVVLARVVLERRGARAILVGIAALVIAPVLVYLLAWTPYLASGHGLRDLIVHHEHMIWFHRHLTATHSQASPWYEWPLMTRPLWMYAEATGGDTRAVIHAIGNPLLWWAFVPAFLHATYRLLWHRHAADALIVGAVLAIWLPWAIVARVAFIQYFLPAVPFAVIAVAATLHDAARRHARVWLPSAYVGACVVVLWHFWPVLTAQPVSGESLAGDRWFWLDTWRGR